MALRKNYSNGKSVYARIEGVFYAKKYNHNISVQLYETDPNEVLIPVNRVEYTVREAEGTGWEELTIEQMNAEGQNVIKIAYSYLKTRVALFSDFEDC